MSLRALARRGPVERPSVLEVGDLRLDVSRHEVGPKGDELDLTPTEVGALDHALDELDRGSSVAIELVGEPGIGKTRLLRELARLAEARGHLVLSGSASELEQDLPFSVFVDALDEYAHALEPALLGSLDDDVRTELAHVLPSLSARIRSSKSRADSGRRYACVASRSMMRRAHGVSSPGAVGRHVKIARRLG